MLVRTMGRRVTASGQRDGNFRETRIPEAQFPRITIRNCPKSPARPYNVALRDTEMVLSRSFWHAYTGQVYG
jgi:hypothetical protein